MSASPPSPARVEQPGEDVRRLGEALEARTEDVVKGTVARAAAAGGVLVDPVVRSSFDRICWVSTVALARWMAGGSPDDGREASQEAFQHHGQVAAERTAPLNEMTKRCLRWRDAVNGVLCDSAAHLGVSPKALSRALAMVQLTLDVTLVRMSEIFETERQRTDDELARRQEDLAFMATHDALTGLPNRALVLDRADQLLARAARQPGIVAGALFIDIDDLKHVNDNVGHAAGDQLLRTMAERLRGAVREQDTVGRLSGDEFVVLGELTVDEVTLDLLADRLTEVLREPVELDRGRKMISVTASIGVAVGQYATSDALLRDADLALYAAKTAGKDRHVLFEPSMNTAVAGRSELEADLSAALRDGQFFLLYQPIFDLPSREVVGVEALIRWRHPQRGVMPPDQFILLAEESGLIVPIGRWVLDEACRQAAAWAGEGLGIGVSVNVSAYQLGRRDLVDDVRRALQESAIEPSSLTLEITETTLIRNVPVACEHLEAIRALGVRVAIDDFGTGYASLSHLQRLPVDILKIDMSFVVALNKYGGWDRELLHASELLQAILGVGQALSLSVIAEGIEEQSQMDALKAMGCEMGQGFLLGKPSPAEVIKSLLGPTAARRAVVHLTRDASPHVRVPAPELLQALAKPRRQGSQ
jgi:diguanylate cyclase (GGDEF)-like protein